MATNIQNAIEQSVQDQNPPENIAGWSEFTQYLGFVQQAVQFIEPWGTHRRQGQLRRLFYNENNTLTAGTITNLIQQIVQTPTELSGGPRLTRYWNDLFQWSQFGGGYDDFLSPVLQDYLTLDCGAFIEIIGPGAPDTPLSQQAVGLSHLDALRCYPTGNPDYPVWFRSHYTGKLHKLHWTRVYRLTDLPSPDPDKRGMGFCALSRALAVAHAQILMSQHNVEKLSDLPMKGIVSISGVSATQYEQALAEYEADRRLQGQDVFRNLMRITSINPNAEVKVSLTPFSQVPDGFDYTKYMQMHVNLIALAIGVDPQDVWPLSGQALGTGTQSKILAMKGRAKTSGAIQRLLTRAFNIAVLPPSLEFKFKPKDTEQTKESAEIAKSWSEPIIQLFQSALVDQSTALQMLANTVPEYADILLDEAGNIRLPDDDVVEEEESVVTDDETPIEASEEAEEETTETDTATRAKDISSTQVDFEAAFKDFMRQVKGGNVTRRRAGVVLRGMISRFGREGYGDGLEAGGVPRDEATDEDRAVVQELTVEQSRYITNMLNDVFAREEVTDATIAAKATMWFNGSIKPFYGAGLMSADKNGMYEWKLGKTEEHCPDCERLDGQIHRLRDWVRKNLYAGTVGQNTKCQGYHCDCELKKRPGAKARGRY